MTEPTPLTIRELLDAPKRVGRVLRTSGQDPEHSRLEIRVDAEVSGHFLVFVRVLRALPENFSFGLRYVAVDAGETVLLRVNGDAHAHKNPDGSFFSATPHIHSFRGAMLLAPPRPEAQTKWAWPISINHIILSNAWAFFCAMTHLTSTKRIDARIRKLRGAPTQLSLLPRSE